MRKKEDNHTLEVAHAHYDLLTEEFKTPQKIVANQGFMLYTDGRRWEELPTDTTELITGAVCVGSSLYVTTDGGMVREWDGRGWRTVAFSAFGGLSAITHVDGVIWACGGWICPGALTGGGRAVTSSATSLSVTGCTAMGCEYLSGRV